MRSDRRRWYSMWCSGVPFLKCTIWPFPFPPTSVLLPIFIRGQALWIQIRSRAPFKTTLCIAPFFSVNIFTGEVLCPKTKELTFLRIFVCMRACVCVCLCELAHSRNHFLLAFVCNSLVLNAPSFCSHKRKEQRSVLQLYAFITLMRDIKE